MADNFVIRNMTKDDAATVSKLFLSIDEDAFTSAFGTADSFENYIRDTCEYDGTLYWCDYVRVAECDGNVVGICVTYYEEPIFVTKTESGIDTLSEYFDEACIAQCADAQLANRQGYAYVDALSVDKAWRGQGIGKALLDDAQTAYGHLMLYCRDDNDGTLDFYEKLGFEKQLCGFGSSSSGEMVPMWGLTR